MKPTYAELFAAWILAMQGLQESIAQNARLLEQAQIAANNNERILETCEIAADEINRLRAELNQQRWITGDNWETTFIQ